jgi:hypothetical protein
MSGLGGWGNNENRVVVDNSKELEEVRKELERA